MTDDTRLVPIRRALLSVSDKTGLTDLGRALAERGVELLSTGGSARALREAGLEVRDVAEVTGGGDVEFGETAWVSHQGTPVAVGEYRGGKLQPSRVFVTG